MPDDPCLEKFEVSEECIWGCLVVFVFVFVFVLIVLIVITCILLMTAPNELEKSKKISVQKNATGEKIISDMNEGKDGDFLRTFKTRKGKYVIIFIP